MVFVFVFFCLDAQLVCYCFDVANKSASVAVTTMDASSPDKPVTITESQLPPLRDDHGGRDRFSGNNWTTQQHNRRRHPSRPIDATDFRNEVEVEEEDDEEERTSTGPWRTSNSSSSYGARFAPYSDEGTSNLRQSLRSSSMYTHGSNLSELPERVEHLEQDRAELLKKLDELRDQLSRSCELGGNGANADQKVRTKTHHRENHSLNDWFHEQPPLPPPPPPPPPPPAVRHFPPNNYHHYHSAMQSHGDFLGGYRDPFAPVPVRRMSNQLRQLPVPVNSYVNCNNGFYDPDSIAPSYPVDTFHHQHNHHPNHIPSRIPPVTFGNRRRTPQFTTCNDCFPVGDAAIGVGGDDAVDDLNYNRRSEASYLAQEPLIRRRPITKQQNNGRWCRPVSGGAPFIVCSNCYQLMQVPPRLLLRDKDRHKLRCGACSHLIFFEVDGNNLIVSNPCSTNMVGGVSDGGGNVSSEHRNEPHTYPDSGDYLHSGDEKFVLSSPPFNMTQEAMDMEGRRVIDSIIYLRDDNSRSAELGTHHKPDGNSRSGVMASTPLREHFGCSSFNHGAGTRSEAGSRSARSEQEKVVSGNATFKQNSVKDVLMATEMDFPADESPNPDMSLDSPPGSCEEELPRSSKGGGGESFLTGLIKKGFRDLSRSNQLSENGKSKVSVNGHRISYRSVKKAEKHAGPIQPGEYW